MGGGVLLRVQIEKYGGVLIYNPIKTFPLFFTGRKLHPPCIGIEASGNI